MGTIEKKIKVLDEYINILESALAGRDNRLSMYVWVAKGGEVDDGSRCGTVACVCGHVAVYKGYGKYDWGLHNMETLLSRIAMDEAERLEQTLGYELAKSIYDDDACCRRRLAGRTELFSETELKHPHLITESSLQDAISYLELIRTKIYN